MKYYISTSRTSAKNKLQTKVDELINTLDKMTTDVPFEIKKSLKSKINDLNKSFPRCRPIKVDDNFDCITDEFDNLAIYVKVDEWDSWRIYLYFNPILGEAKL